jgi:hypothetical protein
MPNIFKETSDHAMHLRDVLRLRITHQESMIRELDTIHIATLGIARLGLSTIEDQRHRQIRMMDFAIDQLNEKMGKLGEIHVSESQHGLLLADAMLRLYEYIEKHGIPIGRDEAQGLQ